MSKPTYKTTADIVAEMRAIADSASAWHGGVAAATVAHLADDIEAAVKRERERAVAEALTVGGMVEASRKRKHSGNAAALREALEEILRLAKVADYDGGRDWNDDVTVKIIDIADRALAAPARNCDLPLVVDGPADNNADKAWLTFKHRNPDAYFDVSGLLRCIDWLFAPATEQKGENDGNK